MKAQRPGSLSRRGADPSSRSSWPELLVSWETRFGGGRSHSRAEYTACYLFFLTGDRSLQENKEKITLTRRVYKGVAKRVE